MFNESYMHWASNRIRPYSYLMAKSTKQNVFMTIRGVDLLIGDDVQSIWKSVSGHIVEYAVVEP